MGVSPCTVAAILGTALACTAALQIAADKSLDDNLAPRACNPACGRLDAIDWSAKCGWEHCKNCGQCVEKVIDVLDRYHVHHGSRGAEAMQPVAEESQSCPIWCERNKNPWVAKCQYDECKDCGPCPVPTLTPTPAPTHAPTEAPTPAPTELAETSPDDIIGQNCPPWCGRHPSPWSTKCTYDECKPCAECPAENETATSQGEESTGQTPAGDASVDAPVDDGDITGKNCPAWCESHPSPWSTKCTYAECGVCTDCPAENETEASQGEEPTGEVPAEAPVVEAPSGQAPIDDSQSDNKDQASEGQKCPKFCQRHTADWSVKCGWEDCGVCEQCATSQGEEPVGQIPAPDVAAPTDEKPAANPQANEGKCPEVCLLDEASGSAPKCALEQCKQCHRCLISFHEVQTCMTHNDCDRSQGLYCADPRNAFIEVNTCFTGLCICIELLPGHPNVVKVGGDGSSDETSVGGSESDDDDQDSSGQKCRTWCERNTNEWSEKCGYEDCAGCNHCSAKEEPTGEAPVVEKPVRPDPETHHGTVEAGDAGVSANSCPAVCVRNEAVGWPEKCGWDDCRQCSPCVEGLHNPHQCMTSTDCDRSKNLYCADPRSAAIEVNTCFTGVLCICIKALHGLPPIVRVGR